MHDVHARTYVCARIELYSLAVEVGKLGAEHQRSGMIGSITDTHGIGLAAAIHYIAVHLPVGFRTDATPAVHLAVVLQAVVTEEMPVGTMLRSCRYPQEAHGQLAVVERTDISCTELQGMPFSEVIRFDRQLVLLVIDDHLAIAWIILGMA